jgi:nitrite reductase/ring-hydroxylating ferredoxin subunit
VTELDRRTVLTAACAGCAGLALAACGSNDDVAAVVPAPSGPAAATSAASLPPVPPLIALADLPVGTSASVRGKVLVTRLSETQVVAFSAVCTHQGCTVEPGKTSLGCPCHGSTYDAKTGAVLGGPAPRPLGAVPIVVRDGGVYRA